MLAQKFGNRPDVRDWAKELVYDADQYPMHSENVRQFDDKMLMGRIEWHDWSHDKSGKLTHGLYRGATIYEVTDVQAYADHLAVAGDDVENPHEGEEHDWTETEEEDRPGPVDEDQDGPEEPEASPESAPEAPAQSAPETAPGGQDQGLALMPPVATAPGKTPGYRPSWIRPPQTGHYSAHPTAQAAATKKIVRFVARLRRGDPKAKLALKKITLQARHSKKHRALLRVISKFYFSGSIRVRGDATASDTVAKIVTLALSPVAWSLEQSGHLVGWAGEKLEELARRL
jgi:hypothetical protein